MFLQGKKVGFIGAGAMAEALITGMVKAGMEPGFIFASDRNNQRLQQLHEKLGINTCILNKDIVDQVDILVLAVKPQVVGPVLQEIKGSLQLPQLVLSIAAGITTSFLEDTIQQPLAVIRVMPNTPALVGAGASALCLGAHAGSEHEGLVQEILTAVGRVVTVQEGLIDSVTGLSGSGPGYVYIMLEALSDAGVLTGLPRDVATTLAAQTMLGSAQMVLETGEHPGKLKDQVTTPGGTTIAGLHALEQGNLRATLINGVLAAVNRAKAMSGGQK